MKEQLLRESQNNQKVESMLLLEPENYTATNAGFGLQHQYLPMFHVLLL
jgi:hypothetical protein